MCSLLKIILFVFNFIFWLSGVALIAGGAVAFSKIQDYSVLLDDKIIVNLPIVSIVAGSIIFFVSFFGCCGAAKQSKCMLLTYIALLVVIIIFELAIGIGAAVYKNDLDVEIEKSLNSTFDTANSMRTSPEYEAWIALQNNLFCCGVLDGNEVEWKDPVPNACYSSKWNGCYGKLKGLIAKQATLLIGIGFGVIAIKVIGIVFAGCMVDGINRGRKYS